MGKIKKRWTYKTIFGASFNNEVVLKIKSKKFLKYMEFTAQD